MLHENWHFSYCSRRKVIKQSRWSAHSATIESTVSQTCPPDFSDEMKKQTDRLAASQVKQMTTRQTGNRDTGNGVVVAAWFPHASTSVCTTAEEEVEIMKYRNLWKRGSFRNRACLTEIPRIMEKWQKGKHGKGIIAQPVTETRFFLYWSCVVTETEPELKVSSAHSWVLCLSHDNPSAHLGPSIIFRLTVLFFDLRHNLLLYSQLPSILLSSNESNVT